ncbi:MAG: hypothetical protein J1E56_06265, partial [Ruminococcus sp.]|nr:hypothetical protein [Ruminococcus sp.]
NKYIILLLFSHSLSLRQSFALPPPSSEGGSFHKKVFCIIVGADAHISPPFEPFWDDVGIVPYKL